MTFARIKIVKIVSRKKLHEKAWTLWSKWIRLKDANWKGMVRCYTCGSLIHWKEANAGHYKHGKHDFNELNVKPQCVSCNKFHHGRLDIYGEKLIKEYGLKEVNKLNRAKVYSEKELKNLIEELKIKLKSLKI